MTDNYEDDSFEKGSHNSGRTNSANEEHNLKLSIDLLSVRNMTMACNLFMGYQLELKQVHTFQSKPPTTVNTSKGLDFKLDNTFASYEF